MAGVRFNVEVCAHRPDGNFPEDPGEACQSSYQRLLDVVSEVPQIPSNRPSGILSGWQDLSCPEDLYRPARLIAWGQIALVRRDSCRPFFSASPRVELRETAFP